MNRIWNQSDGSKMEFWWCLYKKYCETVTFQSGSWGVGGSRGFSLGMGNVRVRASASSGAESRGSARGEGYHAMK